MKHGNALKGPQIVPIAAPVTPEGQHRARLVVAQHAHDLADARLLLHMLGLLERQ